MHPNDPIAETCAEVLNELWPRGVKPEEFKHALEDMVKGLRILKLHITLVPLAKPPPQNDGQKLNTLLRESVAQRGTLANVPAKVDGLSKGAIAVLKALEEGASRIEEIQRVTKYDRPYLYTLMKELRGALGARLEVVRDGRSDKYTLKN